jgi:hypothetical protein
MNIENPTTVAVPQTQDLPEVGFRAIHVMQRIFFGAKNVFGLELEFNFGHVVKNFSLLGLAHAAAIVTQACTPMLKCFLKRR